MTKLLFGAILLLALGGCAKKEKAFYLNFERFQPLGVAPGFVVRHSFLQMDNGEYLLCGTTADTTIFVAHLDELGNLLSMNTGLGPGSAHDIIPLASSGGGAFLMLANQGDSFLSIILDTAGRETERHEYRQFFVERGFFEYARAYAASPASDGGFVFTGMAKQTLGAPVLYALRVDQNHRKTWLRPYRDNTYGTAVQEAPDGYFVLSCIKAPYSYLAVIDGNDGRFLLEKTLFQTAGLYQNSLLHKSGNTFIFTGTRQGAATTDMLYLEFSYDGDIRIERELALGDDAISEYGYCITPSRDGGYVILGLVDDGEMGLLFQKVDADGRPGWAEYYPGGKKEYPGDVLQSRNDLGFFGFGIVETDTETAFHLVKTDEVGKIER